MTVEAAPQQCSRPQLVEVRHAGTASAVKCSKQQNHARGSQSYDHWQVDLVDVSTYREDNSGVRYLLCCLDAFTRYAWVRTLRSKRTKEVAEQFQDVVNESPETPLFLQTDKGREFLGKAFTEILKAEGIRHFTCENDDVKCSMVERFQKTLQESAHRFFHCQEHQEQPVCPAEARGLL